ncbi:MAG: undecaprenyldiphospho-muramoylpentapeptide beta-N-acetylglucosaminyltransferase [Gammaproteobacteria bacterium]|nr:undecaprenyldiphospho-muramoylpentapeptide beta-N-acetylglucosaminyltransferase [Gammaproteobacteria bacterium]
MKPSDMRIVIMAGGTGGHIFPALAIARHLREQGVSVSWLGTPKGMEARVVSEAGFPINYVSISGLRGKGFMGWLVAPLKLSYAVIQVINIYRIVKPHMVVGFGGFVTGPGGFTAWLMRKPLVVHEQNAIPGMTNRILSHMAKTVLEAFKDSFPETTRAIHTGNPVREDIAALEAPTSRIAQHQGVLKVLVIGGSLGAQALNQVLPKALAMIEESERPEVWHQAGANKHEDTRQAYDDLKLDARVSPFIGDMAEAYTWADIVICRAGALTLAEVCAAGLGSILVPFPHAVDDHQTHNAQQLVKAGAALLMPQSGLSAESLSNVLKDLIHKGRVHLIHMAQAARELSMPDASKQVAKYCLEAVHG